MNFFLVAQTFSHIEQESSRIAMTILLADLLKQAASDDAASIAYMALGGIYPDYQGHTFNFAEKNMTNVLGKLFTTTTNTIAETAKKLGDLGAVFAEKQKKNSDCHLTIHKLKETLNEFLSLKGSRSQEAKEELLISLLSNVDSLSGKYIIRIILGKLRLGFSDMTILDAASWMITGDKTLRPHLEQAYNVCADIGHLVKTIKEHGPTCLTSITLTAGIPVRPAAAERMNSAEEIIKKLGTCIAQPKLDGFRLQVHIDRTKHPFIIKFFSRNLQDMSAMFPDLSQAVMQLPIKTLIAEGEAIAYDRETGSFLPFQETVKRRRKYDIADTAESIPLQLYLFDLLLLDGTTLLEQPYTARRQLLEKLLRPVIATKSSSLILIEEHKITAASQLQSYFEETIAEGLEGLMLKRLDAPYQAGKRNFNWIKFKRHETGCLDDTIDTVILGYYAGQGKRASFGIGALLVGVYNEQNDTFETIAKIGTGLTDLEWIEIKHQCDSIKINHRPAQIVCPKELYPDVWVNPELLCIVRADEITKSPLHTAGKTDIETGFALRFPRFMGRREDKSAQDATTTTEIKELFTLQFHKTSS